METLPLCIAIIFLALTNIVGIRSRRRMRLHCQWLQKSMEGWRDVSKMWEAVALKNEAMANDAIAMLKEATSTRLP